MSHQVPTDSNLAQFTKRRRIYIACVHCRKRKIKCITAPEAPEHPCERCARRGLKCEYVAISEQDPPSPSPTSGGYTIPPTGHSDRGPANAYPQSQHYRGYNAPPAGPSNNYNSSHYKSSNPLSTGVQPSVPTNYQQNPAYRPQHPGSIQPPAYNYAALSQASQYPNTRPPPPPSTPAFQGYHVDYNQMFPDPGLNNTTYNPNRRCICPPGPCYCGGRR
ncbi:hypothetical protein DFH09DRAFT_1324411 [Mycena vulgaris]|nr:hypothetical protein DFH09DRAFT_1339309 [Mycena vulgaris]KAJ6537309.1 hypothetical protein DFH09DRAFT_1324411 [Mycena vulgaris]